MLDRCKNITLYKERQNWLKWRQMNCIIKRVAYETRMSTQNRKSFGDAFQKLQMTKKLYQQPISGALTKANIEKVTDEQRNFSANKAYPNAKRC